MSKASIIDIKHTGEELYLLKSSLLPGKNLLFHESNPSEGYNITNRDDYLDQYAELSMAKVYLQLPVPDFSVIMNDSKLIICVKYSTDLSQFSVVTIKMISHAMNRNTGRTLSESDLWIYKTMSA